jgi:hypothetical protein
LIPSDMRQLIFWVLFTILGPSSPLRAVDLKLPLKPKSVRFAVIGDSGTGDKLQYDVGRLMEAYRQKAAFDFVIMLGDNIYGADQPGDFKLKFETPYKPLLDAGVKFYAALGNHDNPNQRFYKPFNMGEKLYYNYKNGNVELFALDSTYMDPTQLEWVTQKLQESKAAWKICYFHHPLYSDARFHGPDKDLRLRLEPIFQKIGVNVVLAGHDHVYERIKPQNGIDYFILGSSGQLRPGDLRPSAMMAKGFDADRAFMLVEIADDQLYFQTVSRADKTVDEGVIAKRSAVSKSVTGAAGVASAR